MVESLCERYLTWDNNNGERLVKQRSDDIILIKKLRIEPKDYFEIDVYIISFIKYYSLEPEISSNFYLVKGNIAYKFKKKEWFGNHYQGYIKLDV